MAMKNTTNTNYHGGDRLKASRRTFLIGGTSTVGIAGLAGCLGADNDNGDDTGDGDDTVDPDSPPEEPDSLTVRAWGGVWQESFEENVAVPFTEETGIEIVWDNTDAQTTRGEIRTAIDQDREPPVNVNWDLVTRTYQSYREGLHEPLDEDIVTNIDQMRDEARPDTGDELMFVNLYPYTYALCYNEDKLEDVQGDREPVESWNPLWDEQYENEHGIYNDPPGDGFFSVLAELADVELGPAEEMEPVWDLVEDLSPNIGYLGTDASIAEAIREGEITYALGYLPNNLREAQEDGEPVGWTIPEEGATVRMDSLSTPQNQSESELYWAQQFINTALDEDVQNNWMEHLQVPMLHQNVTPPDWMEDDPAFPTSDADFDDLLMMDMDVYAEYSPFWSERFTEIVG